MDKEHFTGFQDYKNKVLGNKADVKKSTKEVTKKEALEKAEAIVRLDKEGR